MTTPKHHEKRSSSKANYQNYKSSHSLPDSANNSGVQKNDEQLAVRDRHLRNSYGNHSSNVLAKMHLRTDTTPQNLRTHMKMVSTLATIGNHQASTFYPHLYLPLYP
ncbi:hypothetical protein GH714_022710 [Hevea brasiliensis]|uniref:Uncharacterized protein n=1 Tax=Hevea brasiliensis TaxID=3981 RepID=A0A6A6KTU2_HEVBR|nr:hypothetical protein GH714_022710 [Hevea brasiliensis]